MGMQRGRFLAGLAAFHGAISGYGNAAVGE